MAYIMGYGISSSAVALGFAGYLEHLFGVPYLAGAIGLILLSSVVVFLGLGESAILAGILTVIEASGLFIIIAIGMPSIGQVDLLEMPLGFSGVIGAAPLVFFAYLGFEGMANLSEEMKYPDRDLPKALLLALGITTVFYMLVVISICGQRAGLARVESVERAVGNGGFKIVRH